MEEPDVSVIVVNWNAKELLAACLESLFVYGEGVTMEVFVVDNASSDGSVETIKRDFPGVILMANTENLGFARAANQAIRRSRGRHILLLNPDTLVVKRALPRMVKLLDHRPLVGALGAKVLTPNGRIDFRGGRRFPTPFTEFFDQARISKVFPKSRLFGHYLMGYWDHNDSREVDLLSGACMMVRREALEEVGPLDEDFFLYGEDVEWCYRIKRAGWKIFYYAEAQIIHLGGGSSESSPKTLGVEALRSINLFFKKGYGALDPWLHRLLILLVTLAKEAFFLSRFLVARGERGKMREKMRLHYRVLKWVFGLE